MRKGLALIVATAGLMLASASPAMAATQVYDEVVPDTGVIFIPACIPGVTPGCTDPRGPGSVLISFGDLLQNGTKVGTVTLVCTTTAKIGADYQGNCDETLYLANGTLKASGQVNESAIERFEPQRIRITGGTGAYAGKGGTLTVLQTKYPNEFRLTANVY